MDAFWTAPWWQYVIIAAVFSVGFGFFWHFGTVGLLAVAFNHWTKFEHGIEENIRPMLSPSSSPFRWAIHIYRSIENYVVGPRIFGKQRWLVVIRRGMAILLGTALVFWFEIDIWVGVLNDTVTLKQGWLLQAYLFLPFFLFCCVIAFIDHRWYLRTLAKLLAEHSATSLTRESTKN